MKNKKTSLNSLNQKNVKKAKKTKNKEVSKLLKETEKVSKSDSNHYISEQKLRFYVNAMKYQKYLKELQENPDKFKENFNKSLKKKINLLLNKETDENKEFVQKNVEHYENLKIENVQDVLENFEIERERYLDFLFESLERNRKNYDDNLRRKHSVRKFREKIDNFQKEIDLVSKLNVDSPKVREVFGDILILTVSKILKMPKFSGYTPTWKEMFFIESVERSLQYIFNFDDKMISLKTGKNVTAFNYITQIIVNSIIMVINREKKNAELIKKEIEISSVSKEGVYFTRNILSEDLRGELSKIELNSKNLDFKELKNELTDSLYGLDKETIEKIKKNKSFIIKINVFNNFNIEDYNSIKTIIKSEIDFFFDKDIDLQLQVHKEYKSEGTEDEN